MITSQVLIVTVAALYVSDSGCGGRIVTLHTQPPETANVLDYGAKGALRMATRIIDLNGELTLGDLVGAV